MKTLPEIRKEDGLTWLYVDNEPMYILGGQVMNYNLSCPSYAEEHIWPNLRKLHGNTLLAPVAWQLMEPREGIFDFTLVDCLIDQCRREGLRLIPLWFGLWKSTFATYAPGWVKRDARRFHRIRKSDGSAINSFSPYCQASIDADAKAFAAFMRHLKEYDGDTQTVIMVQCENECGMFRTDRDYGSEADALFAGEVPTEIAAIYGSGTWETVFGAEAPEAFSSWGFAQAVERIGEAGKAEYDLPLFLNAWLELTSNGPGFGYPSGGSISKFMKIWQATAPVLSFLSPNAYVGFRATSDSYSENGNPLMIPETMGGPDAPAAMFYAFGAHNALGFSSYGAEMIYGGQPPFMNEAAAKAFTGAYDALRELAPILQKAHREGRAWGFMEDDGIPQFVDTEKYRVNLLYGGRSSALLIEGGGIPGMGGQEKPGKGGAILIQEDEDTFFVLGTNVTIDIQPKPGVAGQLDYDWINDGHYENHTWVSGRWYNGDTASNALHLGAMPSELRICVYLYR